MRPRFVVDWDSTLVEDLYPEQGDWLPGAVSALLELNRHGDVVIFSCRVAPYEFPTQRDPEDDIARDPEEVERTVARMKAMLDDVGLGHIEIWRRPYKPAATLYIDDKAVRYDGNWRRKMDAVYEAIAPIMVAPGPMVFMYPGRSLADELREREIEGMNASEWVMSGMPSVEVREPNFYAVPDQHRHPNSQRYHDRLEMWGDLHDRKQRDYGSDSDPFANIRGGAAEIGLPAWIGCAIRMRDKMQRILTAARQHIETGEVSMANESLVDSFDDLGIYSGIGAVLLEEEDA